MFTPPANVRLVASIRWLFLTSAALFLATIVVGFLNIFDADGISHAQVLVHFHSGSIGWVTLSLIAVTLWAFTAGRDPGPGVERFARILTAVGAIVVAGYVAAFGLAFSGAGPDWTLPLFGIPTGLVIIAAFAFTIQQRRLITWTAPHLLLSGALAVASLGATMGILIGLGRAGIVDVFPAAADTVASHAAPMDMYLALGFAAVVEALLGGGTFGRLAKAQAALGVLSGVIASLVMFIGIPEATPVALLLFLASFVIYMIRTGWRALRSGMSHGHATFFGALFFPVYIVLFVYLVAAYYSQGDFPPHGLAVAFAHITFVGMATNLLLAAHASFSPTAPWYRIGIWVLNGGLVLFAAGALAAEDRYSAAIMGIGVLIAWAAVVQAHWAHHKQ